MKSNEPNVTEVDTDDLMKAAARAIRRIFGPGTDVILITTRSKGGDECSVNFISSMEPLDSVHTMVELCARLAKDLEAEPDQKPNPDNA